MDELRDETNSETLGALEPGPYRGLQAAGFIGGAVVFAAMLASPVPDGLELAAWRTAAVGLLMAVWWMTEALPIAATSLLPVVLLPLLDATSLEAATAPYANPLIFLFLGGFIIALGMERWDLHRRIALNVIRSIGTQPRSIILGFMVSAAFLSMWVSNTATTVMMLPIGLSVIHLAKSPDGDAPAVFGTVLMLAIAYGCSIGGIGTLIGTPTNAVLAGFMLETYGIELTFARWMLIGLPIVLIGLPIVYLVLTRLAFKMRLKDLPGGKALIRSELDKLGPISKAEKLVLSVFVSVALCWIFRPFVALLVPGISDPIIAMIGALALFILPVDLKANRFVLNWEEAERLPWGVLLIFGGGLSLASAIAETGLAEWIGHALGGLGALPVVLLVLTVTLVVVMLTELTSNVATAAAFLPIMAAVAVGIGENPYLLAVPAVLAASCAFMLPVATPPNAIVYSSGAITIPQMARAGVVLNILFTLVITALSMTLMLWVFDIELGVIPDFVGSR